MNDVCPVEQGEPSKKHLSTVNRVLYAFSHNSWTTKQGLWLSYFAKIFITKSIFYLHKKIEQKYDKDAYIIHDVRMQKDREMVRDFLSEWVEPRIQHFMNAAADIFFFFLKEDARYRRLYIILRNKLILEGQIMALTSIEQDELLKWKGK